ncbi:MAG: hypothetical protein LBB82_08030, partial [Treponema sp.]|nr:hypothetical protein [Treponema sp.]
MIIDFHSHIYPEKIAARAVSSTAAFYTIPARCRGTPEDLAAAGVKSGIDRFVVFSAAAVSAQVTTINSYIASVCAGWEKAGREKAGQEKAGQEKAGQEKA